MKKNSLLMAAVGLGLVSGLFWLQTPTPSPMSVTSGAKADESTPAPAPRFGKPELAAPVRDESVEELSQRIRDLWASSDSADQDSVSNSLLPALVRMDAAAAARLVESLAPGSMRTESLRVVAQLWTSSDASGALAWSQRLPDARERECALGMVCNEIAVSDPALAVREVERVGLGEHTKAMLENLVQRWAERDFPAAKAWAMGRPGDKSREPMLARIALVQSSSAPAEAARFVVDEISSGPVQFEAVMSVIHQWATRDPAGAAAWVELFPPGELRERAEREIAGLAAQDPL